MSPVSVDEARLEEAFQERVLDGLTVDADGSGGRRIRRRSQRVKKRKQESRVSGEEEEGRKRRKLAKEGKPQLT